jgi:hypothetical protein
MRAPKPLHTGVAKAYGASHPAAAPVRGCRRLFAQCRLHHLGNHFRRQGRLASRSRCIAVRPTGPHRKAALPPAPDQLPALAYRTHAHRVVQDKPQRSTLIYPVPGKVGNPMPTPERSWRTE